MQTFTISPRYVDRKGTIPMPTWRNVETEDGHVGAIVVHDGAWTPLYGRWEDTQDAVTVDVLTRAAAQLNAGQ